MIDATASLQPVDFDPFADSAAAALPLTEAQSEMYAAVQMGAEASCAYNQCFALRLRGPLSPPSMERALAQVVARHEALRLRILGDGNGQEILESIDVALSVLDLAGLSGAECDAQVAQLLDRETRTPFDLDAAPLWRAQLVREPGEVHRLIFTAHHLVCDGWSSAVILTDLAACYAADRFGVPAGLAPAASFSAFVEAGTTPTALAEAKAAEAFWVGQYASGVPSFELPLDRPRPRFKTYAAAREVWRIDETLYLAVRKMGAQQGCTLFVTLLAAFEALLARLSESEELVVGVPMASQALQENGHLVAHGVHTIPLRCHAAMASPFSEHLAAARKTFLDAQAHQRLTFGSLVRQLKVPRDASRTPLVNVIFNIDRVGAPFDFGELALEGIEAPKAFNNFELSINAVDSGSDLMLECDYNTDLFDAATVRRWLALYGTALERAAADPARPLADILAPTAADVQMLAGFNRTGTDWPAGLGIEALIAQQAAAFPERIALTAADRTLRYRELDARANQLANLLRSRGIGRGALVGLCLERTADMVVAQLAILKSGAAYVPLDPAYPPERLAYMAQDAKLALMVSHSSLSNHVSWPRDSAVLMDLDAAMLEAQPALRAAPDPALDARAEDAAYAIYTSGSTGKPKGVVVPHRAVVNFLASMAREPGLGAADCLVAVTTLSFDIAVLELLLPLSVGAQVVLASRDDVMDGSRLRALVERSQATVMQATPSSWYLLLDAGWQGSPTFKALVGGESLPPELAQQLLKRSGALWNMYGPTETTVWSTCCKVELPERGISIGRPIANTQVHILDADRRPCPVGVAGEIFIGGAGVALGYLHRPELSAERFVADPFAQTAHARMYRSGDRGRWRGDGMLEHLGRLDSQVKVRGHRIELGEIEANLLAHPQVAQSVVIVREDVPGDLRLVAYVVPRGAMPSASVLREHLRAILPQYMLPQHVVQIDAVPLLPNGKINRLALPAPEARAAAAEPSLPGNGAPPKLLSEAEQAVALIWQKLLATDDVRGGDNFFDLGGHSLLAVQAVAEMRKQLGLRINLRRLTFETLSQLAAGVGEASADSGPQGVPAKGILGRLIGTLRGRAKAG